MLRRNFFATLLAPLVAQFVPKREVIEPTPKLVDILYSSRGSWRKEFSKNMIDFSELSKLNLSEQLRMNLIDHGTTLSKLGIPNVIQPPPGANTIRCNKKFKG